VTASSSQANIFISFFGLQAFNFIQGVLVYAPIESLIFGIFLIFFLGISKKSKGSSLLLPSFFAIVIFMSLLHSAIALAIDTTGALDFATVVIHQVVSFSIMGAFFLFLGMAGNIASHQVKNTLALGLPFGFWIILFASFVFYAVLALRLSKTAVTTKTLSGGLGV